MATIRPDLLLIRGDSKSLNLTFAGIDLTGSTVFSTVKPALSADADDATAVIAIETTVHTDPTAGQTTIALTGSDTTVTPGVYYYDFQIKSASGDITSIPARRLTVTADVTRRVS